MSEEKSETSTLSLDDIGSDITFSTRCLDQEAPSSQDHGATIPALASAVFLPLMQRRSPRSRSTASGVTEWLVRGWLEQNQSHDIVARLVQPSYSFPRHLQLRGNVVSHTARLISATSSCITPSINEHYDLLFQRPNNPLIWYAGSIFNNVHSSGGSSTSLSFHQPRSQPAVGVKELTDLRSRAQRFLHLATQNGGINLHAPGSRDSRRANDPAKCSRAASRVTKQKSSSRGQKSRKGLSPPSNGNGKDDGESDGDDDPPAPDGSVVKVVRPPFACPFFKSNISRYIRPGCESYHSREVHDVKRRHLQPKHYEIWSDIDDCTMDKLNSMENCSDPEKRWKKQYMILFKMLDEDEYRVPDPYWYEPARPEALRPVLEAIFHTMACNPRVIPEFRQICYEFEDMSQNYRSRLLNETDASFDSRYRAAIREHNIRERVAYVRDLQAIYDGFYTLAYPQSPEWTVTEDTEQPHYRHGQYDVGASAVEEDLHQYHPSTSRPLSIGVSGPTPQAPDPPSEPELENDPSNLFGGGVGLFIGEIQDDQPRSEMEDQGFAPSASSPMASNLTSFLFYTHAVSTSSSLFQFCECSRIITDDQVTCPSCEKRYDPDKHRP